MNGECKVNYHFHGPTSQVSELESPQINPSRLPMVSPGRSPAAVIISLNWTNIAPAVPGLRSSWCV